MNARPNRAHRAAGSRRAGVWLLVCVLLEVCGSTGAQATIIDWANVNGGSYSVAGNWIGGILPGANDAVRFGRTRNPAQQQAYTVSFTSTPTNQDLTVTSDRVTLDLNGNTYLLTSSREAMLIGTSSISVGRLTLTDGVVATTATGAGVYVGGAQNASGVLTISAGAQLLGPSVVVGYTGPGTLVLQNGGDLVGGPMFVGSGAVGTATVTGVGSTIVVEAMNVASSGSGTLNINTSGRVESTSGSVGRFSNALGTVNIDGAGSRWTSSGAVDVGDGGPGVLNITNGARGQFPLVIAGSLDTGHGTLNISGNGELISQGACVVGGAGSGSMTVGGGGLVQSTSGTVGGDAQGTVTIDGNGSRWSCSGPIEVPDGFGDGILTITGGGEVTSTSGILGANLGSTGSASVSGAGSRWIMTRDLSVEDVLSITAGGEVQTADGFIADFAGRVASVSVSGTGSRFTVAGDLSVGGNTRSGAIGSFGSVTIGSGGSVSADGVYIFPAGTVNLSGGMLAAREVAPGSTAGGQLNMLSGVLQAGRVAFDLLNAGATLAPGPSAAQTLIAGNYTQLPAATMAIDIGGTTPSTQFDQVTVTRIASLGGTLNVRLINGFVPSPGQTFLVLNAGVVISGPGIAGSFANVASGSRLPITGGRGSFVVHYGSGSPFDPDRVVLSGFASCTADVDDGSGTGTPDGGVTIDDLLYYLAIYNQGILAADLDDGSTTGTPDGGVTIDDLLYYLQRFEAGC